MVSGELTVASAHRSKVHPTTLPLQLLVTGATTTRIMVQLLLLLLLMLPLSTRITLSLLFSVFVSPSGRSTMPIWWLSFLLVQLRVLLCTLLNPLPIQLHFLCHGGSRCIRTPHWYRAHVMRNASAWSIDLINNSISQRFRNTTGDPSYKKRSIGEDWTKEVGWRKKRMREREREREK